MNTSSERTLGHAAPWVPALSLFAIAGLIGLGVSKIMPEQRVLLDQTGAAFFLLGLWACAIGRQRTEGAAAAPMIFAWHRGIWTQPAAQSLVLAYWGLYCPEVGGRGLTVLLQLAFATAMDMLSNWRSRGRLQTSASVLPLVLSINLFLWNDDAHLWQSLVIVGVAVFSKSLWRWNVRPYGHIFNPTGVALSFAGIVYYCAPPHYRSFTRLDELLLLPPNTSEIILAAGLLVQLAFGTAVTTLAGIIAMSACDLTLWVLGVYNAPVPFEAQAFIGLTLLMSDPATSPRSLLGRVFFGAAWGSFFVFIQVLLAYALGFEYVYFGKIFATPLANLLVPWLDRRARRLMDGRPWFTSTAAARAWQYSTTAAIPLVFLIGWSSSAKRTSFEEPMRAEFKILHAPRIQKKAQDGSRVLCADNPVYCRPFSFTGELELWSALRRSSSKTSPSFSSSQ